MARNLVYSQQTTYLFVPSSISDCLILEDKDGNLIRILSDVEFILHNRDVEKNVSADTLRHYVQSIVSSQNQSIFDNATDDELFNALTPRSVNTITDAYKYEQYLKENVANFKRNIQNFIDNHTKKPIDNVSKDKEDNVNDK